tara:strand:+ start:6192 stop:6422 length:231 start_codon:yes stop_codon:yes gene_type:complete
MKALGPHNPWPRVYPRCKWPRRTLITIIRPGKPVMIIKHWHGVPSSGPKTPASSDSLEDEGNASESPSEDRLAVPA